MRLCATILTAFLEQNVEILCTVCGYFTTTYIVLAKIYALLACLRAPYHLNYLRPHGMRHVQKTSRHGSGQAKNICGTWSPMVGQLCWLRKEAAVVGYSILREISCVA